MPRTESGGRFPPPTRGLLFLTNPSGGVWPQDKTVFGIEWEDSSHPKHHGKAYKEVLGYRLLILKVVLNSKIFTKCPVVFQAPFQVPGM